MTTDASHESGPPANSLVFDVPCRICEYNLKTIGRLDHCPECGEPVIASIKAVMDQAKRRFELANDPGQVFKYCEELTGIRFDTIALVWLASLYYVEIGVGRYTLKLKPKEVPARVLCNAVRDVAIASHGLNARAELEALHLATAEQVHDVVLVLVNHGLFARSTTNSWSEYFADDCPDPADF